MADWPTFLCLSLLYLDFLLRLSGADENYFTQRMKGNNLVDTMWFYVMVVDLGFLSWKQCALQFKKVSTLDAYSHYTVARFTPFLVLGVFILVSSHWNVWKQWCSPHSACWWQICIGELTLGFQGLWRRHDMNDHKGRLPAKPVSS